MNAPEPPAAVPAPVVADRALPGAHAQAEAVPDAAVDAALNAVARYWKQAHAVLQAYPGRDLARAMLEAGAPLIADAERTRLAARMDDLAAYYPESVWPPDSNVRDSIGATAMRHAYSNAARTIREAGDD